MARRAAARSSKAAVRRKGTKRGRVSTIRRAGRAFRRALAAVWRLPATLRVLVAALVLVAVWAAVNWTYHVIRKPTELFFPVTGVLAKSPPETWRTYGPLFTAHATAVITPELLAALAQVESRADPVARTYWRWSPSLNPLEVYRPASSAVGMYQITDGTFREARRYCIHDHVVVEDGRWHEGRSCWLNSLYSRVVPSHAVELTAAWLDRGVARALAGRRPPTATRQQQQDLAAVIHLCGARAGAEYAVHGFRVSAGQRCGDHDLREYLGRVNALKREFGRLATGS